MMKAVQLDKRNIYSGNLLLVNAQYPIKTETRKNLNPADTCFPEILIKKEAANVLQMIIEKLEAENSIVPVSGYRSAEEQTSIYDDSIKDNGIEFTKKYVALPNHSEHQTGLAIDLGLAKDNIDFICPDFPYDGVCHEFRKVAPDHGFIMRYAEDKEDITGISHEPWHFRYVGYPHSKIMDKRKLSLEEYTEFIKDYTEDNKYLFSQDNGADIEIYYVPADREKMEISIPEKCIHQISGNNVDGFVVTLWRKKHE